jgi:hypothetical protein
MRRSFAFSIALALAGAMVSPVYAQTVQVPPAAPLPAPSVTPAPAPAPACDYKSVTSPPGKTWWAQQRWRYASDMDATAAYTAIAIGQSPWPNWFVGTQSMLTPGTRFQMAMAPGQKKEQPGGFGTFDNIETAEDVREYLAVLVEWKPVIDRVVIFEVIKALPVQTGPVGPQVDPRLCALLPGRWSQFQMLVAPADRMLYLKPIAERPIQ